MIEYSPYGTTSFRAGTTDTPFLYNGQYGVQTDPNGLLYMRARYYNPYISRFLNPDPSGFQGGLNFYLYCDGNPISETDPFGLSGSDWNLAIRAGGLLQATGGFAQALLGYSFGTVTSPTIGGAIVGAAIGTLGVDNFQAGIQTVFSGQPTQTMLNSTLQSSGLSPAAANYTGAAINIGLTFSAGVYSAYSRPVNSVPAITATATTRTAGSTLYDTSITTSGSIANLQTDISASEFGANLEANGFVRTTSADGNAIIYTKGNSPYSVYSGNNGVSAQYSPTGGSPILKIRLK